jgi:hypothetical protein
MLLIQICLHWLKPVVEGFESPVTLFFIAPSATKQIASRHHIGLAPIHAPPSRLILS